MQEASGYGVRLRRPERGQLGWVAQCADDLVGSNHAVRLVAAVVEKLDLSDFYERSRRERVYLVETARIPDFWWVYGCTGASVGSDRRGNWRGAVRRARRFCGCVAE